MGLVLGNGDRVVIVHAGAAEGAGLVLAMEEQGWPVDGPVQLVHRSGGPGPILQAAERTASEGLGQLRMLVVDTGRGAACPDIHDRDIGLGARDWTCVVIDSWAVTGGLIPVFGHDVLAADGIEVDLADTWGRAFGLDLLLHQVQRPELLTRALAAAEGLELPREVLVSMRSRHEARLASHRQVVRMRQQILERSGPAGGDSGPPAAERRADGRIDRLLGHVAETCRATVLVESPDFEPLKWSGDPGDPPGGLARILTPGRLSRLASTLEPGVPQAVRLGVPASGSRLMMRLGIDRCLGYASLLDVANPTREQIRALTSLEVPLSFAFQQEYEDRQMAVQLRSNVVSQVATGRLSGPELDRSAALLGWRGGTARVVAYACRPGPGPGPGTTEPFDRWHRAGLTVGLAGDAAVALVRPDEVARLGPLLSPPGRGPVERVVLGVGTPVTVPSDAVRSFREAAMAARMAVALGRDELSFDSLGIHRLFLPGAEAGDADFEEPLSRLEDAASTMTFDPIETLGSYLDSGCSIPRAAERLQVHPNSLRYRLQRIATLAGLDLDDPEARFRAQLSIRLRATRRVLAGDQDLTEWDRP